MISDTVYTVLCREQTLHGYEDTIIESHVYCDRGAAHDADCAKAAAYELAGMYGNRDRTYHPISLDREEAIKRGLICK